MSTPKESKADLQVDPLYLHSLREARFILGLWGCCFVYTVTYCYGKGYLNYEPLPDAVPIAVTELLGPLTPPSRSPDSLTYPLGLGIPDWVFYGVVVPWAICILLTFWFCLFLYVEDDLSVEEALPGGSGAASNGDSGHQNGGSDDAGGSP